jgi:hypothetical protein
MIPASERAKTVHAIDGSATVTGIWKEVAVAKLRRYPGACREGLRKTKKARIDGVPADIRTGHSQSTSLSQAMDVVSHVTVF